MRNAISKILMSKLRYIWRRGGEGIGELVPRNIVDPLQRPGGVVVLLVDQFADFGNLLEEAKCTRVSDKLSRFQSNRAHQQKHTQDIDQRENKK